MGISDYSKRVDALSCVYKDLLNCANRKDHSVREVKQGRLVWCGVVLLLVEMRVESDARGIRPDTRKHESWLSDV